jgi:uncharacterized protein YpbB
MQTDISNTIFQQAIAFVTQTNKPLFLTGKAGTGKTTFLKYIRENCFKKLAVIAPTGVAAINAGGVTIHSFFQLPFGMYIPTHPDMWGGVDSNIYNKNQLLGKLRLNASKRELLRELDLLIIDEVSMVRADLLDAVDTVLRSVRRRLHEPFGGVQMLYIGDLFQLPPIVKDVERDLFHSIYNSPFFFDSKAIRELPPVYLELKKIYRQRDAGFIQILNNVRNNCCTEEDLHQLHAYYRPEFSPSSGDGYITLTSHNYKADSINREQLDKLPGKPSRYEAEITGDFSEHAYPAPRQLQLKEGAQIMFIKNDKGETRRYYNGKIGIIKRIDEKKSLIYIAFPDEPGSLELELETWKNIRYKYEQEKDEIKEEEMGSFTQYPIRLAWAVTIHKSQGLTFEKAIVDAGASFAAGQVYVALSRLTSLQGLVLRSRITPRNILTDSQVQEFSEHETSEEALREMLQSAQLDFIRQSLLETFDWKRLLEKMQQFITASSIKSIPDKQKEMEWLNTVKEALLQQQEVADKFKMQLERLLQAGDEKGYSLLHERTGKAADWFMTSLEEKCNKPIASRIEVLKIKSKTKKYVKGLRELLVVFMRKTGQVKQAATVTDSLRQSLRSNDFMDQATALYQPVEIHLPEELTPPPGPEKGATRRISLALYRAGKSIKQIAAERNLKRGTIEEHLITFIASGEVDVHSLVSSEKLKAIISTLEADPNLRSAGIREKLGPDFSYGEIRAVMLHWQREHATEKTAG